MPVTDAPAAATTAASSGTTTATPGSSQTPGDQYLAIVAPANQVVAAFNSLTDPAAQLAVLHDLSTVLGLMAIELRDVTWPPGAQVAVAELVAVASSTRTAADVLVAHPSPPASAALAAALRQLRSAASKVRAALRLPPESGR